MIANMWVAIYLRWFQYQIGQPMNHSDQTLTHVKNRAVIYYNSAALVMLGGVLSLTAAAKRSGFGGGGNRCRTYLRQKNHRAARGHHMPRIRAGQRNHFLFYAGRRSYDLNERTDFVMMCPFS